MERFLSSADCFNHKGTQRTQRNLFLGLQGIPSFGVECADNRIDDEVAGKFAAQNEFIHIRFVLETPGWTASPTVELERDEFLQFYDLKLFADLAQLRKRHFAAAFQNFSRQIGRAS